VAGRGSGGRGARARGAARACSLGTEGACAARLAGCRQDVQGRQTASKRHSKRAMHLQELVAVIGLGLGGGAPRRRAATRTAAAAAAAPAPAAAALALPPGMQPQQVVGDPPPPAWAAAQRPIPQWRRPRCAAGAGAVVRPAAVAAAVGASTAAGGGGWGPRRRSAAPGQLPSQTTAAAPASPAAATALALRMGLPALAPRARYWTSLCVSKASRARRRASWWHKRRCGCAERLAAVAVACSMLFEAFVGLRPAPLRLYRCGGCALRGGAVHTAGAGSWGAAAWSSSPSCRLCNVGNALQDGQGLRVGDSLSEAKAVDRKAWEPCSTRFQGAQCADLSISGNCSRFRHDELAGRKQLPPQPIRIRCAGRIEFTCKPSPAI
jgi:hypothetical protein